MLRFVGRYVHRSIRAPIIKSFSSTPMEPAVPVFDIHTTIFGDYPYIQSAFRSERVWTPVGSITPAMADQKVLIRARVHKVRAKGNSCFMVLRDGFNTVQACAFKSETIPKEFIGFVEGVSSESIVDVQGIVKKVEKPIDSCSIQTCEIELRRILVVNRAIGKLPLQIADASRKVAGNEFNEFEDQNDSSTQPPVEKPPAAVETKPAEVPAPEGGEKPKKKRGEKKDEKKEEKETEQPIVKMTTRLNNRVIDLRTPAKQAIFRLSSMVCHFFREFLLQKNFVQIHTPKLIGGSSEGGSNVFQLSYFNQKACLAQSPQLYKQMCVMGDFQRVFQIGPVFRAENSFTHRHMCEFVGMDIQMAINEHYSELLDFFGELFPYIFAQVQARCGAQLKAINQQFQFEPFKCKVPIVKLTFQQGIQLLKENDVQWDVMTDLSTEVQKKLGKFVKAKYDTDFYMLHRYPATARPFYTMPCHDNPEFTCSFDFFMRGEQILSGAQRIHEPKQLQQRAIEKGIDPNTIRDYISCFQYGAFPHGGGGIGLERVVMLYCALKNIRNASLFPRDPKRITP